MSDPNRIRRQQILREAEGYLDLITVFGDRWPCRTQTRDGLAQRVILTLDRLEEPGGLKSQALFLRGQAYRLMERFAEAIPYFKEGAALDPADTHLRLALAWCHKRNRRLDLAIETLEEALDADPTLAILHYNLACYWSLAGNVKFAVSFLAQAFDLQPNYRELVETERDFDPIRKLPQFLSLTAAAV